MRELRSDAIHPTTLDKLDLPGTAEVRAELQPLVDDRATRPRHLRRAIGPTGEQLLADSRLWQFGLSDRMLDIAPSRTSRWTAPGRLPSDRATWPAS